MRFPFEEVSFKEVSCKEVSCKEVSFKEVSCKEVSCKKNFSKRKQPSVLCTLFYVLLCCSAQCSPLWVSGVLAHHFVCQKPNNVHLWSFYVWVMPISVRKWPRQLRSSLFRNLLHIGISIVFTECCWPTLKNRIKHLMNLFQSPIFNKWNF